MHNLLKWDYQAHLRSRSWQITIQRERLHITRYLKDSPSLKRYLTDDWLAETYVLARLNAQKETELEFPVDCIYSIKDVLERTISFE